MTQARAVLRRVFGYRDFIGKQAEVIARVLDGGNVLALMPTGGGKSLCYQIPALVLPGTAIVVSPLIALMKDQVDALRQHNIRAAYLNSSLTPKQARAVRDDFAGGGLDLIYVAPERLMNDPALLHMVPIALVAIDEAHCVSQWGHDFRPEYLRLGALADELPQVPRLALTATADAQTKSEIIKKLELRDAQLTVASFDRPNIRYTVLPKANVKQQFLNFYRHTHAGESGIIYCMSRRRTEETAQMLEAEGLRALPYHAGMAQKTRQEYQDIFLREEGVIMCATIAFGMGVDKPDVRFVAHFDLPKSVEGYYQETGRAGRDGLAANALLFYGLRDAVNVRKLLEESTAPESVRRIEGQKLNALLAFCESAQCRRILLLSYFGETYQPANGGVGDSGGCDNCDNCLSPPQTWDGSEAAQKFLSAVARTREMFGVGHIVDILTGKETEKTTKFGHARLPTFAIGADTPAAQWRSIARQMIAAELLRADPQYGALKLTSAAWEVLRGKRRVEFRRETKPPPRAAQKARQTPRGESAAALEDDWQRQVFEALRGERRRLSERQNVPAYVIFQDTVLIALARQQPENMDELAQIPGVGAAKLERYGKQFLKVLNAARRQNNG